MLFDLVQDALSWREATQGIFDPAVLNALVAQGYDRTLVEVPAEQPNGTMGDYALSPAADAIQLDQRREITLPAGVGLDLGGIAKGWTIQQTAARAQGQG